MKESGTPFGRYRLERLIGSGGMGDVYEATDLERERVVALKLLPELFSANAEFTERFRRESRIVARLRDPHIIPIHDYGEIDRRLYIDMRLVDNGVTIAKLLREEGPMAPERAVGIIEQVAEALDAAHDDGLVHRDVKPSNVLVTYRDFVYVVDFGIAHIMGQTAYGLTGTHSTIGTLDYMAPERFEERGADQRSDVYSMACLLHECLTARTPFRATTAPGLMYAHLHLPPPEPSAENPALPSALDEVVGIGMAKQPDDRYATAGALADAARRALGGARPTERARPGPADDPAGPTRARDAITTADPAPERAAAASGATAATDREPSPPTEREATARPEGNPAVGPTGTAVAALDAPAAGETDAQHPAPREPADEDPPAAASTDVTPAPPETTRVARPAEPPAAPPPTGDRPAAGGPDEQRPRRRLLVVAGVAAVFLVAVVAGAVLPSSSPEPPSAASPVVASPVVAARSIPEPERIGSVTTPPEPGFVTVDPAGRSAYVTNRAPRALTVLDLATRRTRAEIPMPSVPRFVTVSPDGTRAFVSCYDPGDANSKVAFVDLRSNQVTRTVDVDLQPYAVALAPDQRTLWVPSHRTGSIDVVDTVTAQVTARRPVAPNPHWIVFAGNRAYVINHESNLVTVMDTATATVGKTIPVGRSPHAAALSPDGRRLAVVNFEGNDVTMIDTTTDTVTTAIPVGAGPQHVVWAPDGLHLYTADVNEGTVSVVDTTTDRRTASVPVGSSPTSVALYGAGATAVVTVLDEAQLSVLATGE